MHFSFEDPTCCHSNGINGCHGNGVIDDDDEPLTTDPQSSGQAPKILKPLRVVEKSKSKSEAENETETTDLEIQCEVEAFPEPSWSWKKDSGRIRNEGH